MGLKSGSKRHCEYCGADARSACAKCRSCWYCSRQCQIDDWKKGHKQVCALLAAALMGDSAELSPKSRDENDDEAESLRREQERKEEALVAEAVAAAEEADSDGEEEETASHELSNGDDSINVGNLPKCNLGDQLDHDCHDHDHNHHHHHEHGAKNGDEVRGAASGRQPRKAKTLPPAALTLCETAMDYAEQRLNSKGNGGAGRGLCAEDMEKWRRVCSLIRGEQSSIAKALELLVHLESAALKPSFGALLRWVRASVHLAANAGFLALSLFWSVVEQRAVPTHWPGLDWAHTLEVMKGVAPFRSDMFARDRMGAESRKWKQMRRALAKGGAVEKEPLLPAPVALLLGQANAEALMDRWTDCLECYHSAMAWCRDHMDQVERPLILSLEMRIAEALCRGPRRDTKLALSVCADIELGRKELYTPLSQGFVDVGCCLAQVYHVAGKHSEAVVLLSDLIDSRKEAGARHTDQGLLSLKSRLARALHKADQVSLAVDLFEEVFLSLRAAGLSADHPEYIRAGIWTASAILDSDPSGPGMESHQLVVPLVERSEAVQGRFHRDTIDGKLVISEISADRCTCDNMDCNARSARFIIPTLDALNREDGRFALSSLRVSARLAKIRLRQKRYRQALDLYAYIMPEMVKKLGTGSGLRDALHPELGVLFAGAQHAFTKLSKLPESTKFNLDMEGILKRLAKYRKTGEIDAGEV